MIGKVQHAVANLKTASTITRIQERNYSMSHLNLEGKFFQGGYFLTHHAREWTSFRGVGLLHQRVAAGLLMEGEFTFLFVKAMRTKKASIGKENKHWCELLHVRLTAEKSFTSVGTLDVLHPHGI